MVMKSQIYFRYRSLGALHFDPKKDTKHFEPWWVLLLCDDGIVTLYRWFLKTYGLDTEPNRLWGAHVSVIKGQEPTKKELWGTKEGQRVEFWYTDQIRWDNEKHAWLDCFSPEMSNIRQEMGLPGKSFFHLTLGRLK
jgi:hypothetical protein